MHVAPAARTQRKMPQVRRNTGTPCAMVYGLYALSPESGLVSLRRLGVTQDLIPASGDQDHAISLVRRRVARLATRLRPSHLRLACRDDRDTPLLSRQDARR
jgi:hypothetical protein